MTQLPSGAAADAAEEWVRSWSASVSERAARARDLSERVAQLSVSATDDDELVTVTVAGSGVVTDLHLDERVRRWPAARTATEILAVMRRAQASMAGQVADIATQTVGPDSETARAVVASFAKRFPAEPPADQDASGGDQGSESGAAGTGSRAQ